MSHPASAFIAGIREKECKCTCVIVSEQQLKRQESLKCKHASRKLRKVTFIHSNRMMLLQHVLDYLHHLYP